jgi:hypothetical protein
MNSVGWINSINSSSMVDKLQHSHQAQDEISQAQAGAKAVEENYQKQKKIAQAKEEEKIRAEQEKKKADQKLKKRRSRNGSVSKDPKDGKKKRPRSSCNLDVTV